MIPSTGGEVLSRCDIYMIPSTEGEAPSHCDIYNVVIAYVVMVNNLW